MEKLKSLIAYIHSVYAEVTSTSRNEINLKRTLVSDIEADGAIYESIMEYVRLLNERSADITLQLPSNVTARVKARNSIEYKIQNYKTEQHKFGKVPINKCLNDLFGFRVIMDTPITYEQINEAFGKDYKCIDSSKLEYKAVHLYFRDGNYKFPWELQIWNRCDVESNFASHKKYKQEYTTWEKSSKEGGIIDG